MSADSPAPRAILDKHYPRVDFGYEQIGCGCGADFPEDGQTDAYLDHVASLLVSADSTAGLDVECPYCGLGRGHQPECRLVRDPEEPDAGVHDRNLLDEDTGETAIDRRAREVKR